MYLIGIDFRQIPQLNENNACVKNKVNHIIRVTLNHLNSNIWPMHEVDKYIE